MPHSDGPGGNGEHYPKHLEALLKRYKLLNHTEGAATLPPASATPPKKGTTAQANFAVQAGIVHVLEPAGAPDGARPRSNTRAGNAHVADLVARRVGNVHDAGNVGEGNIVQEDNNINKANQEESSVSSAKNDDRKPKAKKLKKHGDAADVTKIVNDNNSKAERFEKMMDNFINLSETRETSRNKQREDARKEMRSIHEERARERKEARDAKKKIKLRRVEIEEKRAAREEMHMRITEINKDIKFTMGLLAKAADEGNETLVALHTGTIERLTETKLQLHSGSNKS